MGNTSCVLEISDEVSVYPCHPVLVSDRSHRDFVPDRSSALRTHHVVFYSEEYGQAGSLSKASVIGEIARQVLGTSGVITTPTHPSSSADTG